MIYLLLDILIYNFTGYSSYFFLVNISNKDFFTNLISALIIDLFITPTFFLTTLLVIVFYLIKKYWLKINFHNFLIYTLYNLANIFIYCCLMQFIFKPYNTSLFTILIINLIFIIISYKSQNNNINLIG